MGLKSGAISITRYQVLGLVQPSLASLNQGIAPFKAKMIELSAGTKAEQAFWTLPDLPELERDGNFWDMSDCQVDGGYVLRLRIEKRSVPGELLKLLLKERLQHLGDTLGRHPSRVESRLAKEQLKDELLAKSLPTLRFVDLFWSTETNQVTLFSTSKSACMFFEQMFRQSFLTPLGGSMAILVPPLFGLDDSDWKGHSQRAKSMGQLVPATFTDLTV